LKVAKKRIAAGAAAFFCITAAYAVVAETRTSPGQNAIVSPHAAPVRFASFGRHGTAKFNGRFELTGTYRYGYLTNNPAADSAYGVLALSFVPDLKTAEKLPYWQGFAPPATLGFSNPRTFVRRVIPPDAVAKLKQKKMFSISGRAAIVVDYYRAGIECDSAYYDVRFLSVVRPRPIRISQNFVRQYRC
jgi:hypothetical protein